MKILITGGSGFIGFNLTEFLVKKGFDVSFTSLRQKVSIVGSSEKLLDITNRDATLNLIKSVKPDIVIHSAALKNVDLCETNHALADKINIEGTRNVADACKIIDGKIIYISTSAVFYGTKNIYFEDDPVKPGYYYGFTKAEGEKIVSNSGIEFMILRTDQPYGWVKEWQTENSVTRVLKKLRDGQIIRDVVDWYNTPTFVDNLSEVAYELIKRNKTGIYHLVGPDFLNRHEMAMKVAEVFKKDKSLVRPMESNELNLPAKRVNVRLSNKKAEEETNLKLVGFEEGLKTMRDQGNS